MDNKRVELVSSMILAGGTFETESNLDRIKRKKKEKEGKDYAIPDIYKGMIIDPRFTLQEKMLYIYILSYVNEAGEYAFPSYRQIQKELSISNRNTLSKIITSCEEKNMFYKVKVTWVGKNTKGNNMYFPNLYDKSHLNGFNPDNLKGIKDKFTTGEALVYQSLDPVTKVKEVISIDKTPKNVEIIKNIVNYAK